MLASSSTRSLAIDSSVKTIPSDDSQPHTPLSRDQAKDQQHKDNDNMSGSNVANDNNDIMRNSSRQSDSQLIIWDENDFQTIEMDCEDEIGSMEASFEESNVHQPTLLARDISGYTASASASSINSDEVGAYDTT